MISYQRGQKMNKFCVTESSLMLWTNFIKYLDRWKNTILQVQEKCMMYCRIDFSSLSSHKQWMHSITSEFLIQMPNHSFRSMHTPPKIIPNYTELNRFRCNRCFWGLSDGVSFIYVVVAESNLTWGCWNNSTKKKISFMNVLFLCKLFCE